MTIKNEIIFIAVFLRIIVALLLLFLHGENLGVTILRGNLLHSIIHSNTINITGIKKHIIIKLVTYQMF